MSPIRARKKGWPAPLSDAAFIGLAGEIVRAIQPISEADPAAILVQLLVAVGNACGRGPHFLAEADRHGLNLFAVIVGDTAKGRKGTSWAHVRALMKAADPTWYERALHSGLSSAEGLISLVRDPLPQASAADVVGFVVTDRFKRALIVESEFASVLTVMKRQGNNLSEVVRNAWDGVKLETITKHTPLSATLAHISIIGHITSGELQSKLRDAEISNGFLNRFLLALTTRAQVLPHGGRLSEEASAAFASRLARVISNARSDHEFRRDADADHFWTHIYEELSEGHEGAFGAVTSRAEAQVMRLACTYAALDEAKVIGLAHLQAACEVWRYAEGSAAVLFDGRLGNPLSDKLSQELRRNPEGMSRTEIHHFLGNHADRREVEAALHLLVDMGLAFSQEVETGGRPAMRWYAK